MALTGSNFVRMTRHGLQTIRRYWPKMGDRFEVRRHALKLRCWDERHLHPNGLLADLSYERIRALSGIDVYELRIDDTIGGHDNIRIVFFDPPRDWTPLADEIKPLRVIWVLESLPKKRNEWISFQIQVFRSSTKLLKERFYAN